MHLDYQPLDIFLLVLYSCASFISTTISLFKNVTLSYTTWSVIEGLLLPCGR